MNPATGHRALALEAVLPGMRLGEDILDAGGGVLLAAGTILTESHIAALIRQGCPRPTIEVLTGEGGEGPEAVRDRLYWLFRRAAAGEPGRRLRDLLLDYRLERLP